MSPAQNSLYFREWGKVRAHFIEKGIDPKLADNKRHELHRRALGADKSSKDFTNADLDKVLAAFFAITRPADLNAQLRQQDQPEKRLAELQGACWAIVRELPKIRASADPQFHAENYLDTLARSLTGRKFERLGEKDVARVLGILRHRLGGGSLPPASAAYVAKVTAPAAGAREAKFREPVKDEDLPF